MQAALENAQWSKKKAGPNLVHDNEMFAISLVQQPVGFVQAQRERGKRCTGQWPLSLLDLGTFVWWQRVDVSEQFTSGIGSVCLVPKSDERTYSA